MGSNRNKETNARQSVILNSFKRKRANDSSYRKTSFFLHHLSYLDYYSLRSLLLLIARHEKNSSDKNRSLHSSYLRNHFFKLMLFLIMREEESPLNKINPDKS